MRPCDSCAQDATEVRKLPLTDSWCISVCHVCFDREMQWRYEIDKEWSDVTWQSLEVGDDHKKVSTGRNDSAGSRSGDNVPAQK